MKKHFGEFQDEYGNKLQGASIYVYNTGTLVQATIYEDNETTTKTQPISTDEYGQYSFKVADGVYDILHQKSGYVDRTDTAVELYDESDLKAALQALTGFDFIQNSSTTGTPSATGAGQYWLDLLDGTVYLSTGSGTGNWGSGAYQLAIFNSDGDVNFAGGYALAIQNLLDQVPLLFKFNGSSSYGLISDSTIYDISTYDASILIPFRSTGVTETLYYKYSGTIGLVIGIYSDGTVRVIMQDSLGAVTVYSNEVVNDGKLHCIFVNIDRSGSITIEIDGRLQANTGAARAGTISTATNLYIGSYNGASNWFSGEMLPPRQFNFIPSAAERKLLANPLASIPWYMKGATNVGQTSGTVTKGKKYRTSTFVAGDDFSNIADIGASANVTGAVWTATGTTPTTWTNSSVLHPLGAVIAPDWLATTRDSTDEAISTPMMFGDAPNITWTDTEIVNPTGESNPILGTWTPANGDFGTWTTPTFTTYYRKEGNKVFCTLVQTGGSINSGAAGKYFTGLPYTPSHRSVGAVSNGTYADLGTVVITTTGRLYFSNNTGAQTTLSISFEYLTAS